MAASPQIELRHQLAVFEPYQTTVVVHGWWWWQARRRAQEVANEHAHDHTGKRRARQHVLIQEPKIELVTLNTVVEAHEGVASELLACPFIRRSIRFHEDAVLEPCRVYPQSVPAGARRADWLLKRPK